MFQLGNAEKNQLLDKEASNKYYADDFKINIEDKNDVKVIIKDYVKEGSTCLDVGCGAGYLGEILREYRDAKIYGIDIDSEALKVAKKKNCFEGLYNFSITERSGNGFEEFARLGKKFDYIMFTDVLEHVVNAEQIILFFKKYLKPGGELLISLPNVAHLDIVRGLVNQKFNYNHIGLLDNTHLRFYTKSSFFEFIEQINEIYKEKFCISEIGRTVVEPGYLYQYPNFYKRLGNEACVLQYVYSIKIGGRTDNKIKSVKKTFDKLEGDLQELVETREALRVCNVEVERLRARVCELETAVDNIYKSTSWVATRPIRGVSRVARAAISVVKKKVKKQQLAKNDSILRKAAEEVRRQGLKVAAVTSCDRINKGNLRDLIRDGYDGVLLYITSATSVPAFKEYGLKVVVLINDINTVAENEEYYRNVNFYADYLIFDNRELRAGFGKKFDKVGIKSKVIPLKEIRDNVDELAKCFREKKPRKMVDLSVVIPNYNYEKYLPMRIRSILAQTVKPREIILLDDNSTDRSLIVAEPILKKAQEDYGIEYRIIKNDKNMGCFCQWGRGFREAKYDFVWIAEADDYARPNFVETILPSFEDRKVMISYCKSCKIDSKSVVADYDFNWYIEDLNKTKWTEDFVDGGGDFIRKYLVDRNSIPNASATIIRKSAVKGIQVFLDKYQTIGDWFAYIYIIAQGKVNYRADVLNGFRRHEDSIINREEQSPRFLEEKDMILDYLGENFGE